jgi:hypothetical protein
MAVACRGLFSAGLVTCFGDFWTRFRLGNFSGNACRLFEPSEFRQALKKLFSLETRAASEPG